MRGIERWVGRAVIGLVLVYLAVAYLVMPAGWNMYTHVHPALHRIPNITYTHQGIPGDPLNVALVGSETQVKTIILAAGWYPADPITFRSSLKIAEGVVLKRPDDDAPVSNLYLFGRKEDLAFEKPVGNNPRQRHHVRFWRSDEEVAGQPVWIGAATYDERVGLSHKTGQITHHIRPDIDTERDVFFHDMEQTGKLARVDIVKNFHIVREGRNGGGDPWRTDGDLYVGVIGNDGNLELPMSNAQP